MLRAVEARRPRWTRRVFGERGQALVETAMLMPVLALLLITLIELGDSFNAYMGVISASRDGARLGSKGDASDSEIRSLVITDMGRMRDPTAGGDITITRATMSGNPTVEVRIGHRHNLLFNYPLFPISGPITMCAGTRMRKTEV